MIEQDPIATKEGTCKVYSFKGGVKINFHILERNNQTIQ